MSNNISNEETLKISIITPSYNQAQFIDDTILSVLNQNYKNFEHIIIDGGSNDGTIEILQKYSHLKWVSEKDNGQSDAINKGFRMATGDIIAWLNSDDYYEQNIFNEINQYFKMNENCYFLHGNITFVDRNKKVLLSSSCPVMSFKNLLNNPDIVRQPSCFWKRSILTDIGFINEKHHLVMDLEYFLRIGKKYDFHYIANNISNFRLYSDGKSSKYLKRQFFELVKVLLTYGKWNFRSYFYLVKKFIKLLYTKKNTINF
jgi:glycosyltransferase involved in cell wall biosynthesis